MQIEILYRRNHRRIRVWMRGLRALIRRFRVVGLSFGLLAFCYTLNMASSNNQWEVVKKSNKKNKQQPKIKGKHALENMPKIEVAPPVKESATIYDAFAEKEKPAPVKNVPDDTKSGSKKQESKKKPGPSKKKESPQTLEEALKQLDAKDFEVLRAQVQTNFPGNPSVWLKDFASLLNLRLERVVEPDPIYEDKPVDYPMSLVPAKTKTMLKSTMNDCSTQTLALFLEHCVQNMIIESGKGSTHGYRIMVQMLLRDKPEIALDNLKKYLDHVRGSQGKFLRCLTVLWSLGQAGLTSLPNGLKIWLELMLPLLSIRNLSTYAVQYLETLFSVHKNLSTAHASISFREFFPILDLIFNNQPQVANSLQKRLIALYPCIKKIAVGSEPQSSLRNFFPSYLARLNQNCSKQLKAELLDSLVECLAVDKHCFSQWRNLYVKHLQHSGILLQHIHKNYSNIRGRLEHRLLQETVQAFTITNDELASKGSGKKMEGFQECVNTCKALLSASRRPPFPWKKLLLACFAICAFLLAYDIVSHKGFRQSFTYRHLNDWGVLAFLNQVWLKIATSTSVALQWLQDHAPAYLQAACDSVHPYLQSFWENLYDLGVILVEATAPLRQWLNVKVPLLLDWVNAQLPWLLDGLSVWGMWLWGHLTQAALWVWSHVVRYMDLIGTWLLENVFTGGLSPENILKAIMNAVTYLGNHCSNLVQWGTQAIAQATSSS